MKFQITPTQQSTQYPSLPYLFPFQPFICKAFTSSKLETLHHHLCHFAQLKELEIEEVCKAHCQDFILAVNNLRSLLSKVDSLKSSLSDFNSRLQHVTCLLLLPLNAFVENAMSRRM